MNKIIIIVLFSFFILLFFAEFGRAESDITQRLAGKILLEVQSRGEAWYVNPADLKRYYLGRPADAFALMRALSIGITNADLAKIPVGLIDDGATDGDGDGLSDSLENALGTDPEKNDSDGDGYGDKLEIENNYTPLGNGRLAIDENLVKNNSGKIFLQVEHAGEAWYLEPTTKKRYFLSRPSDAFDIMKKMGLGITNKNIEQISIGYLGSPPSPTPPNGNSDAFYSAASAIMSGDNANALSYFTADMQTPLNYTLNFLDSEGKFNLGNIMAGAKLSSSTENEKIYSTAISFAGYNTILNFRVKKQTDGKWLLANL